MKDIYFIDNESIKRTAKAIQKNNPTFKHTIILDDLAQMLGYTSYNQYEHYLTNLVLSKDADFNNLKALTKIDSLNLFLLQNKFKNELANKGYFIDSLYFIKKTIENQLSGFFSHSPLNLNAYIYYLPLIFEDFDKLNENQVKDVQNGKLQRIIQIVIDEHTLWMDDINNFLKSLQESPDPSSDSEIERILNVLHSCVQTRGLSYYFKSIIEDFEYDEGFLTSLILKGYSAEKIEHIINIRLNNLSNEDKEIPVFFKKEKAIISEDYFPFIKSSITETNPFILGRHVDQSPFFATNEQLHSNISVLGSPGTGKGVFIYQFLFQALMNNRGFCIVSPMGESCLTRYVNHIATTLNKKSDVFIFNETANPKLISGAIHNDKIVLTHFDTRADSRRRLSSAHGGSQRFEEIVTHLSEHFFTAKFRNKKIPFYVYVEEAHYLMNINEKTTDMIRKLNALNVFFIFEQQVHEDYINDLCDITLITNSSFMFLKNAHNFEFSQLIKELEKNQELIGKTGPSRKLPPVFSLIHKGVYCDQFITEIDENLLNNVSNR